MRKCSLLFVLFLMAMPLVARANVVYGDANGDGQVNITDVLLMINYVMKGDASSLNMGNADINGDGQVNITDVTGLITAVLNGTPITPPTQEHEWVDLGLPSGTLWATCNIGANSPEDYGGYFAWGETTSKDYYDWTTYKWCNGSYTAMTKYCTNSDYGYNGFTDGNTELDPEDDVAYVNWGPSWRMPTRDQQIELLEKCTWTWTTQNGENGDLVTGPNGNSLFLPAAGGRWDEELHNAGIWGYYWSRTRSQLAVGSAYYLYFRSGGMNWYGSSTNRNHGFSVRAVRVP